MEKYIIKLIECFVDKDEERFKRTVDEICIEFNANNKEILVKYIYSLLYPSTKFVPM